MNNILNRLNGSVDTTAHPSPAIWSKIPVSEINQDPSRGWHIMERFIQGGLITAPTTEAALVGIPYSGFGSSGSTQAFLDEAGGGVVLNEATDNEAVYIYTKSKPFQISANLGKAAFECRVKVSAITVNQIGFICGLFDDTAATVVVPLSTANPPIFATTGNFVGFWGREQDTGAVRTTYVADGVTSVVVQTGVHTFVADTYVKLGMTFNYDGDNKLHFYVNNVKQSSTKTIPDNTGTDFPADRRLGFFCGHRLGAGTSSDTTIKWWRGAQLFT